MTCRLELALSSVEKILYQIESKMTSLLQSPVITYDIKCMYNASQYCIIKNCCWCRHANDQKQRPFFLFKNQRAMATLERSLTSQCCSKIAPQFWYYQNVDIGSFSQSRIMIMIGQKFHINCKETAQIFHMEDVNFEQHQITALILS